MLRLKLSFCKMQDMMCSQYSISQNTVGLCDCNKRIPTRSCVASEVPVTCCCEATTLHSQTSDLNQSRTPYIWTKAVTRTDVHAGPKPAHCCQRTLVPTEHDKHTPATSLTPPAYKSRHGKSNQFFIGAITSSCKQSLQNTACAML